MQKNRPGRGSRQTLRHVPLRSRASRALTHPTAHAFSPPLPTVPAGFRRGPRSWAFPAYRVFLSSQFHQLLLQLALNPAQLRLGGLALGGAFLLDV